MGRQAAEAEAAAARSVGQAKETALKRAELLRDREQAYFVEGTRQITKVTNTISMARNAEAMRLGGKNSFTPRVLEMNAYALRVGAPKNGLSPIEFEVILRERFGVTLEQFTEEMAACLV